MASYQGHGLKLTDAEKRRAAEVTLRLRGTQWDDKQVAEHLGLAPTFVGDIRAQIADSRRTTVEQFRDLSEAPAWNGCGRFRSAPADPTAGKP